MEPTWNGIFSEITSRSEIVSDNMKTSVTLNEFRSEKSVTMTMMLNESPHRITRLYRARNGANVSVPRGLGANCSIVRLRLGAAQLMS